LAAGKNVGYGKTLFTPRKKATAKAYCSVAEPQKWLWSNDWCLECQISGCVAPQDRKQLAIWAAS
jgi:hypothetical protein